MEKTRTKRLCLRDGGGNAVSVVCYHGTPMTPRAALLDVCKGRAMCVSFYRPDDVEAVEAISPAVMFRQRRVQRVEGCTEARRGMVHPRGLDTVFQLVGAASVSPRQMGSHARCTGRAVTAQRCTAQRMAVRCEGCAALAHGRACRKAVAALRKAPARLPWVDGAGQVNRQAGLSRADGSRGQGIRQPLAHHSHDARDCGCPNVSVRQRGRNHLSAEWASL